jgi:hypothetical protein
VTSALSVTVAVDRNLSERQLLPAAPTAWQPCTTSLLEILPLTFFSGGLPSRVGCAHAGALTRTGAFAQFALGTRG